jgi:hypothetical protein
MKYEVTKVSHIWSEKDDRWVYLEYNDKNKIVGMNFMQGNDYEYFKKMWCENNEHLLQFYREMLYTFPIECDSVNTIEFINKCMWAFHSTSVLYDEYGSK